MQERLPHVLTNVRHFLDTGNLVRFLFALILAFALWAWVTAENDPEIQKTLPAVPVVVTNVPPGMRVVGALGTVEMQLQGPRSRINAVETGSVQATVDLKDITEPGLYQRTVNTNTPSGVRVRSVVPEKITVQVERGTSGLPEIPEFRATLRSTAPSLPS